MWEGGLQFFGGFVAALAVLVAWLRRHRDVAGLVVATASLSALPPRWVFGRVSCYAVGEHLGGPGRLWLATRYLGGRTVEGPLEASPCFETTSGATPPTRRTVTASLFALGRAGPPGARPQRHDRGSGVWGPPGAGLRVAQARSTSATKVVALNAACTVTAGPRRRVRTAAVAKTAPARASPGSCKG